MSSWKMSHVLKHNLLDKWVWSHAASDWHDSSHCWKTPWGTTDKADLAQKIISGLNTAKGSNLTLAFKNICVLDVSCYSLSLKDFCGVFGMSNTDISSFQQESVTRLCLVKQHYFNHDWPNICKQNGLVWLISLQKYISYQFLFWLAKAVFSAFMIRNNQSVLAL